MTEPLRIVHCFRSPVGGIFRHVRDLSRAQVAAGHAVGIVCDSSTGGDYEARLFDEMRDIFALGVARTPMQRHVGPGDIASAWRTCRILKRMRPDVLHGHGAKGGVYARLFGTVLRLGGTPVARLYSPHGGSLHYDRGTATGRLFFTLERVMDRFTDHLLFVSRYEEATFRAKVGAPRAPHTQIYNGVAADEFEPVPTAPDAADFLYIGMMRDLKGPDLFIEALAEAERRTGRTITAHMVGDGEDRPRYEALAAARGLAARVAFHAAMPARQAFALARIVVVPSRAEAMPYIVLEALAAGKPMIASAVGGVPEIFGDGSRALVQPDSAAIAERMAEALADEAGFAAAMPPRAALEARFSAAAMARQVIAVYRAARDRRA